MMDRWEALARRYCAISGRDPDRMTNGIPEWEYAMDEVSYAMTALDTFALRVRERFESPESAKAPKAEKSDSDNVVPFPYFAA